MAIAFPLAPFDFMRFSFSEFMSLYNILTKTILTNSNEFNTFLVATAEDLF